MLVKATILLSAVWVAAAATAQAVAANPAGELVIAARGKSEARILVAHDAAQWEAFAARDLAKYIKLMSGADVPVVAAPDEIAAALKSDKPLLIVGSEAIKAQPALSARLQSVARKAPFIRAEAVLARREGNRVLLAGLTDDGHYHAVSYLLHQWGCRWYMPTDFGECVPECPTLKIDRLDYAYAPPFEVRDGRPLWNLAWLGSSKGWAEFSARNFKSVDISGYGGPTPRKGLPNAGHALGDYIQDILPPGRTVFNSPISDEKVIAHVAGKLDADFKKGLNINLGINDGDYSASGSKRDEQLQAGLRDKYFVNVCMTDVFMTFYNGVCEKLLASYPNSPSKIAFFIYTNLTIPPQQVQRAAKPLCGVLAPIDIDPTHGMDDPRSPPKQEYRDIVERWAEVMEGRVYVYDYDQGMLVWRDLPNPSHQAFRQDVKHYRRAGILGFTTESRGAYATIFLNMYFRAQLMWDPDFNVDAAMAEFYTRFYGPAAEPMSRYWGAIYKAWEETICTEHEWFVVPVIYTPELVATLKKEMAAAEQAIAATAARKDRTRSESLYVERVNFTRLSCDVIDRYTGMVRAGAGECDYAKAAALGKQGLASRAALKGMNEIFVSDKMEEGPAWFPGEVAMYGDLAALTGGIKGDLVGRLPLEWAFLRDPNDSGLARGLARKPADLSYWKERGRDLSGFARKDYPIMTWEMTRTDLYPQGQGVLHPDGQAFTGYSWYKTETDLTPEQVAGKVHVRFPGLFANAWLYVNGRMIAYRPQADMFWGNSDYTFSWDVDLTGALKPGRNDITVRNYNNHHVSGMFRRPFLYRAKE
jgi:hypothetical protein